MVDTQPLLIDSGNTRLKWQLGERSGVIEQESELLTLVQELSVERILLASVTDRWTQIKLQQLLAGIQIHEVKVKQNLNGLKLVYDDVSTLGVDRWLNMLASLNRVGNEIAIVVSMGTAMTVDAVKDGQHLGGYIVPGLLTQAKSLYKGASALPMVEFSGGTVLGVCTQDCINHGILKSACSFVESVVTDLGDEPQVIVTGGDASYLSKSLSINHIVEPKLVFKGLEAYWAAIS